MQDDLFFSRLTVRETLDFTAAIRSPPSLSRSDRKQIVERVIASLRLQKCQHTRIGDQQFDKGISGGERKRVNIANELLHDPRILLADECTSGLDSSSAYTVIRLLKQLCEEGRTVIATIHQPSSQMFHLFDRIMLLAEGHVAYFGAPSAAISYFTSIGFPFPENAYNPADYMLELVIDYPENEDSSEVEQSDEEQSLSTHTRVLRAWQSHGPHFVGDEQVDPVASPRKPKASTAGRAEDEFVVINMDDSPEELGKIDSNNGTGTTSSSSEEEEQAEKSVAPNVEPKHRGPARALHKRYLGLTGQRQKDVLPDKYPTSWWMQVAALGRRSLRQKRGNLIQRVYILQVISVMVICVLFWFRMRMAEDTIDDRLGSLFFFCVFWAFFSMFSALYAFPAERAVLNKDRASGAYRLSAYYFAKTSVSSLAIFFCCVTCFEKCVHVDFAMEHTTRFGTEDSNWNENMLCGLYLLFTQVDTPADTLYPIMFSAVVYYAIGLNANFSAFVVFTCM